jgi:hypothetical protein
MLYQPMSSPMMNRMFGSLPDAVAAGCCCACALRYCRRGGKCRPAEQDIAPTNIRRLTVVVAYAHSYLRGR